MILINENQTKIFIPHPSVNWRK